MRVPADEEAAVEAYVRRVHPELAELLVTLFDARWAASASPGEQLRFLAALRLPDAQLGARIDAAVRAGEGGRGVAQLAEGLGFLVQPVLDAYRLSADKERVDAWAARRPASDVRRTHTQRCDLAIDAIQRSVRAQHGASEQAPASALRGSAPPDLARKLKSETWALPHGTGRAEPCVRARVFEYAPRLFAAMHRRAWEEAGGGELLAPSTPLSLSGWRSAGPAARSVETSSRSGAAYWQSSDGRLFLKTLSAKEARVLRGMLGAYEAHLRAHPASLLPRFVGLFKVRLLDEAAGGSGGKVYVCVIVHLFHLATRSPPQPQPTRCLLEGRAGAPAERPADGGSAQLLPRSNGQSPSAPAASAAAEPPAESAAPRAGAQVPGGHMSGLQMSGQLSAHPLLESDTDSDSALPPPAAARDLSPCAASRAATAAGADRPGRAPSAPSPESAISLPAAGTPGPSACARSLEQYDLKGSTVDRSIGTPGALGSLPPALGSGSLGHSFGALSLGFGGGGGVAGSPSAHELSPWTVARKDLDLQRAVRLGPSQRALLLAQLQADLRFLEGQEVMDYSLLLGVADGEERRREAQARAQADELERARRERYLRGRADADAEAEAEADGRTAPAAEAEEAAPAVEACGTTPSPRRAQPSPLPCAPASDAAAGCAGKPPGAAPAEAEAASPAQRAEATADLQAAAAPAAEPEPAQPAEAEAAGPARRAEAAPELQAAIAPELRCPSAPAHEEPGTGLVSAPAAASGWLGSSPSWIFSAVWSARSPEPRTAAQTPACVDAPEAARQAQGAEAAERERGRSAPAAACVPALAAAPAAVATEGASREECASPACTAAPAALAGPSPSSTLSLLLAALSLSPGAAAAGAPPAGQAVSAPAEAAAAARGAHADGEDGMQPQEEAEEGGGLRMLLLDTPRTPHALWVQAVDLLREACAGCGRARLVSVDVSAHPALAARWAVVATPTVLLVEGQSERLRLVGMRAILASRAWLPATVGQLGAANRASTYAQASAAASATASGPISGGSGAQPDAAAPLPKAPRAPADSPAQREHAAPLDGGGAQPAPAEATGALDAAAAATLAGGARSLFRCEVGGMGARGPSDELLGSGEVFILGLVDILQQWDFSKRVESSLKALRRPMQAAHISAVDPRAFRLRLAEYVARIVE